MVDRQLRFALKELALVGCGAVPGAWLRWQSGVHLGPVLGGSAWSDLMMNLVGSLILGFLVGSTNNRDPNLFLMFGVGFCGCLTTFSGLMLQITYLLSGGKLSHALVLLVLSLCLGILFAWSGHRLAGLVFQR